MQKTVLFKQSFLPRGPAVFSAQQPSRWRDRPSWLTAGSVGTVSFPGKFVVAEPGSILVVENG